MTTTPRLAALLLALLLGACHASTGDPDGHDHGERHDEEERDEHDDHDEHDEHDDHGGEHDDHGEPEEGVVRLSEAAASRSGVRVEPVTRGSLRGSVEVPAEVQLNPDRVAHISPLVEGQLLSVEVTLGDRVEPHQDLARLRSVELGQARAELSRTSALSNMARQTLQRQERLRREGINSERSLLEAQLAFKQANAERNAALSRLRVFGVKGGSGPDMTLSSPIAGVILERHATRGENVSPDDTLFIVADLSRVWVIGRVYEQQIGEVAPGMQAQLTLNAYPGRSWVGAVDYVDAAVDEETRTLPVRVELENPGGLLRPGLFGTLRLSSGAKEGAVVLIPQTSVQTLNNRPTVFVPGDEAGEFVARPVTLGRSSHGQVEVLEGLAPDGAVVVQGGFVLKSELMRDQLGHGHAH